MHEWRKKQSLASKTQVETAFNTADKNREN